MKIKTSFANPPIPLRTCDWSAVDDDTYDGPGCRVGWGATERDAIRDLLDQLDDMVDYTLDQLDKIGENTWQLKTKKKKPD